MLFGIHICPQELAVIATITQSYDVIITYIFGYKEIVVPKLNFIKEVVDAVYRTR